MTQAVAIDTTAASDAADEFRPERYFLGRTDCWGLFENRFGTICKRFTVAIDGWVEADGTLVMDEAFTYSDGSEDHKVWRLTPVGPGRYEGRCDGVVGTALGTLNGDTLDLRYRFALAMGKRTVVVRFNDRLVHRGDGVLINRTHISKWGLRLGTALMVYRKADPTDVATAAPWLEAAQ